MKLCRTVGSIHLFKITVKLTPEQVTLKSKILWDILEIDWKEVSMTLNGNKVHLPTSVIIHLHINSKLDLLSEENPSSFI